MAPVADADATRGLLITPEMIAHTGANTVWAALRLTVRFASFTVDRDGRPSSIRARGRSSIAIQEGMLVYVDRTPLSDLRLLDDIPASRVDFIRVLRGPDATTYFGTNAGDGVILVFLRTR